MEWRVNEFLLLKLPKTRRFFFSNTILFTCWFFFNPLCFPWAEYEQSALEYDCLYTHNKKLINCFPLTVNTAAIGIAAFMKTEREIDT